MSQTPPDAVQLAKLGKMASALSKLFWPGLFGVFLCFFENSPYWAFFIVLTGWIGIVMGADRRAWIRRPPVAKSSAPSSGLQRDGDDPFSSNVLDSDIGHRDLRNWLGSLPA